jgi:uncharacterized membrane-anchored protein YitT (DUF2179 family)
MQQIGQRSWKIPYIENTWLWYLGINIVMMPLDWASMRWTSTLMCEITSTEATVVAWTYLFLVWQKESFATLARTVPHQPKKRTDIWSGAIVLPEYTDFRIQALNLAK